MVLKIILALLIVLSIGIVSVSSAQQTGRYEVAGIDNAAAAESFFYKLQRAVAEDNRAKVASMIDYPIFVRVAGRRIRLRRKVDLLGRYNLVFNHGVRQALARQRVSELFVNWQGVMIGDGEIWFNQMPNSSAFKITAINN
ncbi:MAG: hypothetical protein AUG51_07955 [Acidobacteria bacterium 13_1_20CM_3_53_8]|nr:MAG: hypothetical protein AUG51_07955 [Acidobacteria bacterium 13_1_20CM_3_53_8]